MNAERGRDATEADIAADADDDEGGSSRLVDDVHTRIVPHIDVDDFIS